MFLASSSSSSSSNVDLLFELEEEITACAILHMLNIGHGHKHRLKELKLGRYKYGGYGSAYVTVLEGIGRAIVESKQKKGCSGRGKTQANAASRGRVRRVKAGYSARRGCVCECGCIEDEQKEEEEENEEARSRQR